MEKPLIIGLEYFMNITKKANLWAVASSWLSDAGGIAIFIYFRKLLFADLSSSIVMPMFLLFRSHEKGVL